MLYWGLIGSGFYCNVIHVESTWSYKGISVATWSNARVLKWELPASRTLLIQHAWRCQWPSLRPSNGRPVCRPVVSLSWALVFCDFLLFHGILPKNSWGKAPGVAVVHHHHLQVWEPWGLESCVALRSQWFPKGNMAFQMTFHGAMFYRFTMLFVSPYSSSQVHHSSLLEVLLPLRLQALDTEFTCIKTKSAT